MRWIVRLYRRWQVRREIKRLDTRLDAMRAFKFPVKR